MNENVLYPKRKIVEITLPSFSWRSLFSLKAALLFGVLFCAAATTYWALAIHPFLWLSSGRVEGVSVQLRSQEGGMVSEMAVQDGDLIKKGQFLFSLENHSLIEREQKVERAIVGLQDELESFKVQSERAMQDYLSSLGVSPQEEIEQHLLMLQEAQSKSVQLQSDLASLEDELIQLAVSKEKYRITSPFEGIVLKKKKGTGDLTSAGESVLSLFDLSHSWIEVRIPEKKLHQVELGQSAKIHLPAFPGREWEGTVSWIGPATLSKIEGTAPLADNEEIPVKISFKKEGFPLKPGLSAEVGIKVH